MSVFKKVQQVHIPTLGYIPLQENGVTFKLGGFVREHKKGELPEYGGYTETSEPASLDIMLNAQSTLDLESLRSVKDENITITLADGEVWLMPNAWLENNPELSSGDVKLIFTSNRSEKIS